MKLKQFFLTGAELTPWAPSELGGLAQAWRRSKRRGVSEAELARKRGKLGGASKAEQVEGSKRGVVRDVASERRRLFR